MTVVRESRGQIAGLFGFLIAAFAVALGRGVAGAQTTGGRVAAAVFGAVLIALLVSGWIRILRRPTRLEVSGDEIRLVPPGSHAGVLSRRDGDQLRFVRQHSGPLSRAWTLGLGVVGTGTVLPLPGFFSRRAVRQACQAQGWTFVG